MHGWRLCQQAEVAAGERAPSLGRWELLLMSHPNKLGAPIRGCWWYPGEMFRQGPSHGFWVLPSPGAGWRAACHLAGQSTLQSVFYGTIWQVRLPPLIRRLLTYRTGGLRERGHRGVSSGQARQALLYRGQLPPAGGAHRHRGDHRVSRAGLPGWGPGGCPLTFV